MRIEAENLILDMLETQYQCANNLSGIFGLADLDIGHTRQLQDIPPEIKQAVQDYETTMEYCNTETRLLLVSYLIIHDR